MTKQNGKDPHRVIFSLSSGSIVKLLLFVALAFLLYLIREILILALAALILSMALESWVHWLQGFRLPRVLSVLIIFTLVFGTVTLTIILLIPPVYDEISDLVANFPTYYDQVTDVLKNINFPGEFDLRDQINSWLSKLSDFVGGAASGVISTVMKVFGGLFSLAAFLVMTIYFVASAGELRSFFTKIAPKPYQSYIHDLIPRLQSKLGLWLRGQVLLCVIIFVLVFIGLSLIGVKYAFLLALLAGVLEIIPYAGPLLSAVPGVFFALAQSPTKALLALLVYVLAQQIENNFLVPKVMGKQVDLNPIVVIMFLLVGTKLQGILGTLLAVPVAAVLSIIFADVMAYRESRSLDKQT
jgi:predicted PurR-regulated permease PerM